MYEIIAEVKKGMQAWGTIKLHRDFAMTEQELIKTFEIVEIDFDKVIKTNVEIRNFQCNKLQSSN